METQAVGECFHSLLEKKYEKFIYISSRKQWEKKSILIAKPKSVHSQVIVLCVYRVIHQYGFQPAFSVLGFF